MNAIPNQAAAQSALASPKKDQLLTKSELADAVDQLIKAAVAEKEMAAASTAFMRAEVLHLLQRKVTRKFALKVRAKWFRQLASAAETASKALGAQKN